ncbi:MAG TPA: phosphoribosylanthranilate isomerase [Smithella sp.]|nr:phosphoribosylanthranilate isomerase [Smithella sp.]
MMQVKVCGITSQPDAEMAAQCGASVLGFIFYQPSPRYIQPDEAGKIIEALPEAIISVGVFVNEKLETVKKISDDLALDMIQLHGDESPDYCRQFPAARVIKALHLQNRRDVEEALSYDAAAILADSRRRNLYGGTGEISDWELARNVREKKPLILSGGLRPENIRDALHAVAPDALDINSGVESAPGKKDHEKLRRVFDVIRACHDELQSCRKIFSKRTI